MSSLESSSVPCFHCGLDSDPAFSATIDNEHRNFCCLGCQAVTQTIAAGGLIDFYQYRDVNSAKAEENSERFDAYDLPEVQSSFVTFAPVNEKGKRAEQDGRPRIASVKLLIGGISCAACAWLIENYLEKIPGLNEVRVNASTHICRFKWDAGEVKLSQIFSALHDIGYRPQPGNEGQAQALRKVEHRTALLRIGVAGLAMMQVGMVAIALHAGSVQGIDVSTQHLLRWVSLIFAIPVMCYSAKPFFQSAYRALKLRHLNMDVPVSLALILAFAASVVGTFRNIGEVYFDSVSMFTFFLLVGRFLEMRARHTSVYETERLSQLLPVSAERYSEPKLSGDSEIELVPLSYIKPDDLIRVSAGEVIPCDGLLESGTAMADESLLTGESEPVPKNAGDKLYAGAMLAEPSIALRVSATGTETRLSSVQALLDQAIANKPKQQQLADKVARYFVATVLVCFAVVYASWYFVDADRAFWIALSVLVVTCPCALSLATPAALAAGLNRLRGLGLLIVSPSALETLPAISHVALDKTGTLTLGEPQLQRVELIAAPDSQATVGSVREQEQLKQMYIECVAALERYCRHPIAKAFARVPARKEMRDVTVAVGKGVEGKLDSDVYRFGRADFADLNYQGKYPGTGNWQLLSKNEQAVAWFLFADQPRNSLSEHLCAVKKYIPKLSVFSGDRQENINLFLRDNELSELFMHAQGSMSPEQKLVEVQKRQADGDKILMVGDGINDVPVLAAADMSIAMGSATQLAKVNADAVLLNQNLKNLSSAREVAASVNTVIKQNFAWALGYNILALPAAAMGYIPPYLAAIGMSLSSLVVVLNSLRVNKK